MQPVNIHTPEVPENITTSDEFIEWLLALLDGRIIPGDMVLIDRDDTKFLTEQWKKIKEKEKSTHD